MLNLIKFQMLPLNPQKMRLNNDIWAFRRMELVLCITNSLENYRRKMYARKYIVFEVLKEYNISVAKVGVIA